MESRVVPAMGVTMFRSSPSRALVSDDLPTFGLPTMAKRGSPASGSSAPLSSGNCFTTSSRRSPVPLPVAEEMHIGSPRPRRLNSYEPYILSPLSTLLQTSRTGLRLRRRMSAISWSKSVMPVSTSTIKRMRSLSSMAIITCLRISSSKISSELTVKPPVSTTENSRPFQSQRP